MTRVLRFRIAVLFSGLLLACAFVACGGESVSVRPGMRLEQWRPGVAEGVYLNEPMVLHFSAPLDPLSVTRQSLRVQPEAGGPPARGEFEVDGRRLRFRPAPVLTPGLMDGGFRPGTTYIVELAGFPRVDGLRARDGRPLERTYRWRFTTAAEGGPLFADQTPRSGSLLHVERGRLGREDPIRLTCKEPIDPTTLRAEDFSLQFLSALRTNANEPPERVALRARLVRNSERGSLGGGASIELRPADGEFEVGKYRFTISHETSLRDFGGNFVWPNRPGVVPPLDLYVVNRETEIHESFLDTDRRSPLLVPGVDGAAFWANEDWGTGASASPELFGKVTIRYPAAAGDGSAGRVVLHGQEQRTDVHAARLSVPAGERVELVSAGTVVLRSQGTLHIGGELVRRGASHSPMVYPSGLSLATRPSRLQNDWKPTRLSDWLQWAQREDRPWTVLIAGGDLVLEPGARLATEGPLLLVAGGRVVVLGELESQDDQLFVLGEYEGSLPGKSYLTAMFMDPPIGNPLVEPLHVAIVSAPLPRWGGVNRWISASIGAFAGDGTVTVRYLPESLDPRVASVEEWGPTMHPADLPGGALRLLIEIEQPPADEGQRSRSVWNPPFLDDVHLTWEPKARAPR